MKKLYILVAMLLSVAFVVNSCKPDNDDKWPKEWPIHEKVLDYFYFQPGTYWVYENDKTGDKDTISITHANKLWKDGAKGEKYELAETYNQSSFENYTYHFYMFTQGSSGCVKNGSKNPCYALMCSKYKPGDVLGESIALFYDFRVGFESFGDFVESDKSRLTIEKVLDTLNVNGNNYYDVCKIKITYALIGNRKDIRLYWAKDYGIVKKENISDNQTWNLIHSQIIK